MNTFSIQTFKRSVAQNGKGFDKWSIEHRLQINMFLGSNMASKKEWNVLPQNIKEDLSVDTLD